MTTAAATGMAVAVAGTVAAMTTGTVTATGTAVAIPVGTATAGTGAKPITTGTAMAGGAPAISGVGILAGALAMAITAQRPSGGLAITRRPRSITPRRLWSWRRPSSWRRCRLSSSPQAGW